MGGLNIINPVSTADHAYSTSRKATILLTEAMKGIQNFSTPDHTVLVFYKQDHLPHFRPLEKKVSQLMTMK